MKIAFRGPQAFFYTIAISQIFENGKLLPKSNILDCFKAVKMIW